MSIISRLKRLWELSGTTFHVSLFQQHASKRPPDYLPVTDEEVEEVIKMQQPMELPYIPVVRKPIGQATVMEDDPLDIFPSDEQPTDTKQ